MRLQSLHDVSDFPVVVAPAINISLTFKTLIQKPILSKEENKWQLFSNFIFSLNLIFIT